MGKYVYFNGNARIHQLPLGGVIEVNYKDTKFKVDEFEYLDINETAYEACMSFDGTREPLEILKSMCQKYNEDLSEHLPWFENLVRELLQKNVLSISEKKEYRPIHTSGSKEYVTPLHATFEITHKCNLECKHCYLESSPKVEDTLSLEEFKRIASEMYHNGVLTCEITGGEVFVHPQAKEMLEFSLGLFHKIGILTNATLLREDVLNLLTAYKEKIIVAISLDSANPEKHDKFRGKRNAFKQTCRNIQRLAERGIFVRVGMSIYEDNMWEIGEMASLVRSLGAKAFAYNWIDDFGRGKNMEDLKKFRDSMKEFNEFEMKVVEANQDIIPLVPLSRNKANNCGAGWRSVVMDPHGNLRPCALFPKNFSLGNLKTQDYKKIFSGEIVNKLWQLQAPQQSSLCSKECPFSSYCSGCYLKGLNANKNHREHHCNWTKGQSLEPLLEYV
ncbi:radical SAM/SPASM domain-containing protein [Bacillus thermotolerans]|uniref:radical SAM/SPASM domain-containing protein n=1 Tax=Bacillus thermotolerans TaxID=1221996 RepID=UPI00057EC7E9|nr:radical SAM protein [Bacillus thermotolerans]KKB33131.1 Radical SAM domain heme biosynthesis protein [Bacillus thermotolerans]KKB36128.1 Radical SAM domain heme biosynthesis protein [Bacillus thermotolerans]